MLQEIANAARFIQHHANAVARRYGYHHADTVVWGAGERIAYRSNAGWVKMTNNQPVPKRYVKICRGKGVRYAQSHTVVQLDDPFLSEASHD